MTDPVLPVGLEALLADEIDTLCQAIEGHRAGALTNDGLWHYHDKARKVLEAVLSAEPRQHGNRTECCGVPIDPDERFCRKCGWEARVTDAERLKAAEPRYRCGHEMPKGGVVPKFCSICEKVGQFVEATEPRPPAAAVDLQAFVDRCDELRNASPNAFYGHVDAFCKQVRAALAAPREDK